MVGEISALRRGPSCVEAFSCGLDAELARGAARRPQTCPLSREFRHSAVRQWGDDVRRSGSTSCIRTHSWSMLLSCVSFRRRVKEPAGESRCRASLLFLGVSVRHRDLLLDGSQRPLQLECALNVCGTTRHLDPHEDDATVADATRFDPHLLRSVEEGCSAFHKSFDFTAGRFPIVMQFDGVMSNGDASASIRLGRLSLDLDRHVPAKHAGRIGDLRQIDRYGPQGSGQRRDSRCAYSVDALLNR
jgi:hypothetical protein